MDSLAIMKCPPGHVSEPSIFMHDGHTCISDVTDEAANDAQAGIQDEGSQQGRKY